MTTPTDAQIAKARAILWKAGHDVAKDDLVAALTAAAEIGQGRATPTNDAYVEAEHALWQALYDRGYKEATERCAQAVLDAGGDNAEFHCAAIRALKEKNNEP